jgi:hypothetical protein
VEHSSLQNYVLGSMLHACSVVLLHALAPDLNASQETSTNICSLNFCIGGSFFSLLLRFVCPSCKMVNPAQKLKKVAEFGATAKAIERDIRTFQQARQTFVTSVRVRSWGTTCTGLCGRPLCGSTIAKNAVDGQHLLLQDRLDKDDVLDTLKCLMEHNIVGILCCPLTSGMAPPCSLQQLCSAQPLTPCVAQMWSKAYRQRLFSVWGNWEAWTRIFLLHSANLV